MRQILTSVFLASICFCSADEKPPEIDSYESSFHYRIHDSVEFCLVCYTSVEKKPWRGAGEQLLITATIVDVIRGSRKIGDRIKFQRVLDGKYGDISHLSGSLNFIRFDKAPNPAFKKTIVDAQDPQAVFRFSEAFHIVALKHKIAEQGGAEQPATAPQSKSQGNKTPKPESKVRSQ